MDLVKFKHIFLLCFLCLFVAKNSFAYNGDHGPFEKAQMPKAFKFYECKMTGQGKATIMGWPITTFTATNGSAEKIVIDPTDSDDAKLTLFGKHDTVLARSKLKAGFYAGMTAYYADLNADNKTDYVVYNWAGGCGLASGYTHLIFILSNGDGFKITAVTTLFPGPEDFVDMNNDGKCEFIHTTFVYGEEKSPDGKHHNYWVYNLLSVEGDELKMANDKDKHFSKWIYYSFQENHKETKMLTREQKDEHWEKHKSILPEY